MIISALANAWLHARGADLPEEVIILPVEGGEKRMQVANNTTRTSRFKLLETYPNPSADVRWLVYELPPDVVKAELVVHDMMGNLIRTLQLSPKGGIAEVSSLNVATGVYIGTLLADGLKVGQTRMVVQQ